MNYNSIFRGLLLSCFIISVIFISSSQVSADCSFVKTSTGFSIICSDTILEEVIGTEEMDFIHLLPQASINIFYTDIAITCQHCFNSGY